MYATLCVHTPCCLSLARRVTYTIFVPVEKFDLRRSFPSFAASPMSISKSPLTQADYARLISLGCWAPTRNLNQLPVGLPPFHYNRLCKTSFDIGSRS